MRAVRFSRSFAKAAALNTALGIVLSAVAGGSAVHAQTGKSSKAAPSGNEVRYFTALSGLMGDQADVILKETRQAGRVTAASLDVCYPASTASSRMDRFALDLKVDGARLTGTTQTTESKQPVAIDLTRKANGRSYDFNGKITIGSTVSNLASTDNSDISAGEFSENENSEDKVETAPADFTEVSPESLAFKIKRDAVVDFIKGLRGQHVQVALYSLTASCAQLRSGDQIIRLSVDPERAQTTLATLKTMPGVVSAGWTDGTFDMERTIRFASADWRENGKLDRDKLAAKLSDVLAQAMTAKPVGSKWNDATGELTVTLKRPSETLPALGLTETIEVNAMVGPDRPGSSDRLMLWLGSPSIETARETAGARLDLADSAPSADEEGDSSTDDNGALTALARELKAQRWDSENSEWK